VSREDPVRELLQEHVRGGAMPGAAWRVEERGKVLSAGAVGDACIVPSRESALDDTPYDLASLTKPLATCLVAVLLEQRGSLDLDIGVAQILDAVRGSAYEGVSLFDLGTHRAGFPAWRPIHALATGADDFFRLIVAEPPAVERGRTLYSDLGFLLLGAAIERAAGARLDALFDRLVAAPLGLESTGFAVPPGRFARAAATENGNAHERALAGAEAGDHRFRESVLRGEVHDGNAHALGGVAGNAGLFATAAEVAAIAREMLFPGALGLGPRARRLLLEPATADGTRTFGFVTAAGSAAARGALPDAAPGHTGFTGTSVWLDPSRGRIFVLLTNRVHPVVTDRDFQPVRVAFHRTAAAVPAAPA